jgi:hypothetical protein
MTLGSEDLYGKPKEIRMKMASRNQQEAQKAGHKTGHDRKCSRLENTSQADEKKQKRNIKHDRLKLDEH